MATLIKMPHCVSLKCLRTCCAYMAFLLTTVLLYVTIVQTYKFGSSLRRVEPGAAHTDPISVQHTQSFFETAVLYKKAQEKRQAEEHPQLRHWAPPSKQTITSTSNSSLSIKSTADNNEDDGQQHFRSLTFVVNHVLVSNSSSHQQQQQHITVQSFVENATSTHEWPHASKASSSLSASTTMGDHELAVQLDAIKSAINTAYVRVNRTPRLYCPSVPEGLKGRLNVSALIDTFHFTNLVQFHDNKTYNVRKGAYVNNDFYYVNKVNYNDLRTERERHFWRLWNCSGAACIDLLNKTAHHDYGADAGRLQPGGHWQPVDCVSRFKVAIIIPYRDRLPHLNVVVTFLHHLLQRQMLDYRIMVVEPSTPLDTSFNKGRVMNAAFIEAQKLDPGIQCVIFHDVDLIPEDDRIMYTCAGKPKHISVAIDKFNYALPYSYLVGGVFAIRTEQYQLINGYSNSYWGWGGEDDDLSIRIKAKKLDILRPPVAIARYKMMRHKLQALNKQRHSILRKARDSQMKDGLNSVKYTIVKKNIYPGFTYMLFDIGKP